MQSNVAVPILETCLPYVQANIIIGKETTMTKRKKGIRFYKRYAVLNCTHFRAKKVFRGYFLHGLCTKNAYVRKRTDCQVESKSWWEKCEKRIAFHHHRLTTIFIHSDTYFHQSLKIYKFMKINYLITGAGLLCLAIAGFLVSPQVGFFVTGLCILSFGLIFDLDRLWT